MHELITVSLGQHANHVLTHAFNQQLDDRDDAVDSIRCWRTADRPQLVLVDAQGVLGRQVDQLQTANNWDGDVLDVTGGVTQPSDSLDTLAHFALRPSALLLPGVHHGVTPLQGWLSTADHHSGHFMDELHDRLRREAEACDHAQCLVVVADDTYGATTHEVLLYAKEELRSVPRLAFDVAVSTDDVSRALAAACYQQHAALQCIVDADERAEYPTAVALDDVTLPQRLFGSETTAQWVQQLGVGPLCGAMEVSYAGRARLCLGPRGPQQRPSRVTCMLRGPDATHQLECDVRMVHPQPHRSATGAAFSSTTCLRTWKADDAAHHAAVLRGNRTEERCMAALEYFEGEC